MFSYQIDENFKIHITEENKFIDHKLIDIGTFMLPVLPKKKKFWDGCNKNRILSVDISSHNTCHDWRDFEEGVNDEISLSL